MCRCRRAVIVGQAHVMQRSFGSNLSQSPCIRAWTHFRFRPVTIRQSGVSSSNCIVLSSVKSAVFQSYCRLQLLKVIVCVLYAKIYFQTGTSKCTDWAKWTPKMCQQQLAKTNLVPHISTSPFTTSVTLQGKVSCLYFWLPRNAG